MPRSTVRRTLLVLAATTSLALLPACARNLRAEREGAQAGEAVCDLHEAEDQAQADEARADLEEHLAELGDKYLSYTAEDRADVAENVDDLVEHVLDGDEALVRQDVAVITRSLEHIEDDLGDASQAAVSGFEQGVDDCT